MEQGYSYLILGAGKQGIAAAYDVVRFGNAVRLTLADSSVAAAKDGVRRLHRLIPALKKKRIAMAGMRLDARHKNALARILKGHHAVLSCLPYYLNPRVAEAALAAKVHYCDLGGYFDVTRRIMRLHAQARKARVTLIPDCGVAPGLCNSLAVAGIEKLSKAREVHIYCGGLPQKPHPPLGYKIVFNLEGVLGNYFGKAYVLRHGKVMQVPSFSGKEEIRSGKPLGTLEAVITGGATSTCPWTFQGQLQEYDYKTLRYPGHYEKVQLLKDLGLLETTPLRVNGYRVVPRKVFVAVAEPRLRFPNEGDLLVLRVIVKGRKKGKEEEIVYDVLDYYDPKTRFTAMQRMTGFSAAIMLEMLAQGRIHGWGVIPVEKAMPGHAVLKEVRRRGIGVKERIR